MGHSIIPPSSAWIWGAPGGCTGWVTMNLTYPETEPSESSLEGEAAHEIGEQLINDGRVGKSNTHTRGDWSGIIASNGELFTDEMFDSAEVYAKHVIKTMRKLSVFGDDVHIEESIKCPSIHEHSHGTPDVWLFDEKSLELHVWDFKHGRGVVEAFENWQAINYLSGILDHLEVNGYFDQIIKVFVHIVQPRAYHEEGTVRTWSLVASDLRGYFNQLKGGAEASLNGNAVFKTGSHCKNCPGRHACPAALQAGVDLFEASTSVRPVQLDDHNIGVQLSIVERAYEHLKSLRVAYREQIEHKIKSGASVSGWGAKQKPCNLEWSKSEGDIYKLGDMLGLELRKTKPLTPKQALDAGLDESLASEFIAPRKHKTVIKPIDYDRVKQIFK